MALSTTPPWPHDIELGGIAFMLARQNGAIALQETWPQDTRAGNEDEARIEWRDWIGGAGAMRDFGDDPSIRRTLMYSDSPTDLAGVDASYGTLMLAPEVVPRTIDAGTAGSKPVILLEEPWTDSTGATNYWLAVDTKIYKSASGQWNDAALVQTFANRVTDLLVFSGTNGASHLYVALDSAPMAVSANGSTFTTLANPATLVQVRFDAVYVTKNSGTAWTDATAVLSDKDNATNMDLDALPATAVGQILFGFFQPFVGASIHIPASANTAASVMTAEFYNGSGWTAVTGLVDGTNNAGKSFGFVDSGTSDHTFTWTAPSGWEKALLVDTVQAVPLYFIRLTFSAAFSATVRVSEAYVHYQQSAQQLGKVGPYFWIGFSNNRVAWTQDGGTTPVWHFSTLPVGEETGSFIALLAANGAIYARHTHGLSSPRADGTVVSYLDGALRPPVTATDQAATAWLDELFVAHEESLFRFSPLDQSSESMGPERLALVQARPLQGRVTVAIGDRSHALYAVLWNAELGRSWLWKLGGYLLATDRDGVPRWQRRDSWFCLNNLGTGHYTSAACYVDASGEPRLVLGTDAGTLGVVKLVSGINPLEDAAYRFTTAGVGEAYLATLYPPDAGRVIAPLSFTLVARDTATGRSVAVDTKNPSASTWTLQGTWTTTPARQFAADATGSLGLDVRLRLASNDATRSPRLILLQLGYGQPLAAAGHFTATILCADDVADGMGRRLGHTAKDWTQLVMGLPLTPIPLVKPDGSTTTVRITSRQVTYAPSERAEGRKRAIKLGLSEVA